LFKNAILSLNCILKPFFLPKDKARHLRFHTSFFGAFVLFNSYALVSPLVFLEPAFVFFVALALVSWFRPLYFFFTIGFCIFFVSLMCFIYAIARSSLFHCLAGVSMFTVLLLSLLLSLPLLHSPANPPCGSNIVWPHYDPLRSPSSQCRFPYTPTPTRISCRSNFQKTILRHHCPTQTHSLSTFASQ